MPKFCTNCGEKLESGAKACPHCGKDILRPAQPARSAKKRSLVIVITGMVFLSLIGFYVWNASFSGASSKEAAASQAEEAVSSADPADEEPNSGTEEEKEEKSEENDGEGEGGDDQGTVPSESLPDNEEDLIAFYEEKLNDLPNVHPFDLGVWTIDDSTDEIIMTIEDKKREGIQKLYRYYDAKEYEALRSWAKDIFYIAQNLKENTGSEATFSLNTICDEDAPYTMFSSDLVGNSGSCGYSIPILTGNTEEDLYLFLHTRVFKEHEELMTRDFDVPAEVDSIKETYSQINENEHLYDGSQPAMDHTQYMNEAGIRKKLVEEKMNGAITESYYSDHGELLYIYTSDQEDGENRFYFSEGLLIRWIDSSGSTIDAGSESDELLKYNHYWQEQHAKWIENDFY